MGCVETRPGSLGTTAVISNPPHHELHRKVRSKLPISYTPVRSERRSFFAWCFKHVNFRNVPAAKFAWSEVPKRGGQNGKERRWAEGSSRPGRILHGTPGDHQQILRQAVNFRRYKAKTTTDRPRARRATVSRKLCSGHLGGEPREKEGKSCGYQRLPRSPRSPRSPPRPPPPRPPRSAPRPPPPPPP
jgi:hypothetical protein